jgi:cobalamin biosynthesis protein CobD/CbiB
VTESLAVSITDRVFVPLFATYANGAAAASLAVATTQMAVKIDLNFM